MKRYRITLMVLALLAVFAAWLLLSRRSGTYRRSVVDFAVPDTSLITAVEISDTKGRVMLSRYEGSWVLNGTTPVRKDRMKGMLILLSRLEVISPLSRSRSEEVSRQLLQEGIRVSISLRKGEDREYLVFQDTAETNATYMMLRDASTAFRMGVRGYGRRDLAALYATDERYWRDNLLLHYLPEQMAYISLWNNRDPGKSFQLARNEEGQFELSTGAVAGKWVKPDPARLSQYLGYFYGVRFEAYADTGRDNPLQYSYLDEPDYVLEVSNTTGTKTHLELFPVFITDAKGNKKMDYNVLYAKLDGWDGMVIVKYLEIDPVLKDPGYFQGR